MAALKSAVQSHLGAKYVFNLDRMAKNTHIILTLAKQPKVLKSMITKEK